MSQPADPTPDLSTASASTSPAVAAAARPFDFDRQPYAAIVVWLGCIALAVLCNSGAFFGKEWIWTDDTLVGRNPLIGMLSGLQQVWTGVFSVDPAVPNGPTSFAPERYLLPQYSPLSQTMFFIERMLFGDNPLGYRIVSMLLHGSCGLLIYQLLRSLQFRGALFVALLFVAHPIVVDSVSFITERRNPLALLLGLSSLIVMLRAAGATELSAGKFKVLPDDRVRLYAIGIALLVLALFAHPAIATLPLVGLLILWVKRVKVPPAFAISAFALVALGALLLTVSSRVEKAHSGYDAKQWERAPTAAQEIAVRTQIAGRAVAVYVQKLAIPYPLSIDYGRWVTPNDLENFRAFASDAERDRFNNMKPDVAAGNLLAWAFPAIIVVALVALAALSGIIGRLPFALFASFILLLLPFLGFIDLGWMQYTFASDRAVYFATLPFVIALVAAMVPLLSQPSQRVSMIASVVIVMIVLIRLSIGMSVRYQMNLEFWRGTDFAANTLRPLTRAPWYSRFQAANYLIIRHPNMLEDAGNAYNDVIEKMRPGNPEVIVQLGRVLGILRLDDDAMARFAFVTQNYPEYGEAFRAAGDLKRTRADENPTNPEPRLAALALYRQAVQADPLDAFARVAVAETAFEVAKRLPDADTQRIQENMTLSLESFDQAIELRPYDVDLLLRISRTLIEMQLLAPAASHLNTARTIAPNDARVYVLIGDAALAGNEAGGAEAAYKRALEVDPSSLDGYLNYSALLASQKRFDESESLIQRGLDAFPANSMTGESNWAREKLLDAQQKLQAMRSGTATTLPTTRAAS